MSSSRSPSAELRYPKPPSRSGKKPVTAYVDPSMHKQLRMLAVDRDTSSQQLLVEALEEFLAREAE